MNENCIKTGKLLANRISPFYYTNIAILLWNRKMQTKCVDTTAAPQCKNGENCIKYIRVDKSKNITPRKLVKTELNNKADRITINKKLAIRGRKGPTIIQGTTITILFHRLNLYERATWFIPRWKLKQYPLFIHRCSIHKKIWFFRLKIFSFRISIFKFIIRNRSTGQHSSENSIETKRFELGTNLGIRWPRIIFVSLTSLQLRPFYQYETIQDFPFVARKKHSRLSYMNLHEYDQQILRLC